MLRTLVVLGGIILGSSNLLLTDASSVLEVQRLETGHPETRRFGRAVAIDGGTAVVSSPFSTGDGVVDAGVAHVFARQPGGRWEEIDELVAVPPVSLSGFGYNSVAVSDGIIVVGAPFEEPNGELSGAAYVFGRDGSGEWHQVARLTASDAAPRDWFGNAVAVAAGTILVGAHHPVLGRHPEPSLDSETLDRLIARWGSGILADEEGIETGVVYVFERDPGGAWLETDRLVPHAATHDQRFGSGIAAHGDVVAIGASGDYENGSAYAGAAYIFVLEDGRWVERAKVLPDDDFGSDNFGSSVGLHDDTLVGGASNDQPGGVRSGSAYAFDRVGEEWVEREEFLAPDRAEGDLFGVSVAVHGRFAAIGAERDEDLGPQSGSVSVFKRGEDGTWSYLDKVVASDGTSFSWFGHAVAVDEDTLLVGAPRHRSSVGSTYVFRLPPFVAIDVKPDSLLNTVNPYARGVVPVGILGSEKLDVSQIAPSTLAFGGGGASTAHDLSDPFTYNDHLQDLNLDGISDLVVHFPTQDTGIDCDDISATLTGQTTAGQTFEAADSIQTVGCRAGRRSIFVRPGDDRVIQSRGGAATTPQRR